MYLLLKKYENLKNIFYLSKKELKSNEFLSENLISEFINEKYKLNLEKYQNYIEKNKIEIVNFYNEKYPNKLNFIQNRPIVLYMKGNSENINNESACIVGSRQATFEGKKNSYYFSYELAKRNVNIISGLAKGIDTYAHIGAIRGGGKTIAVLGCGVDIIYPKENRNLYKNILNNNGLIISEFIVGTEPDKHNFPRRNRIISGISDAIIVIEASQRSGALITANYGINQGKDVWAIPGNIWSYNYIGTNNLIKDGANILTNIDDILR